MDLRSPRAVLDVGTGTGAVAAAVRRHLPGGTPVVGVDLSLEMLRFARRDARCAGVAARLPALPFRSNTFDAVTAAFSVSHVSACDAALAEMARVCRAVVRGG